MHGHRHTHLLGDTVTRPRGRILALLAAVAICLLGAVIAAPEAQAHAELVRSTPAAGAHLTAVPKTVTMTFSEGLAVQDCAVEVGGRAVPIHQPSGSPDVLVADLSAVKAGGGRLTLDWRSVSSDDGHVKTGTLSFVIGTAAAPSASSTTAVVPGPDPAVNDTLIAVQGLGFLGTALYVGGLAFLALIWPPGTGVRRIRVLLSVAWLLGLAMSVAQTALQAAYTALLPLGGVLNGSALLSLFGTQIGAELIARTLLWLLGGVVLAAVLGQQDGAARSRGWRIGLAAVAFGLLRTTSMPGHDDAAHPLLGAIADTAHLAGVSLWIGGLFTLLFGVLPRRRPQEMAETVARYSKLALASMLLIIGAGTVLAWQLVGSLHGLLHTSYGHTLLLKLAVVACVLLLAQHSKNWVRHRLDVAVLLEGDRATVRPFVYTVAAEAGLALAVLAVASVLISSAPGR
ncbi:MAG TPA: CopD family protein [Actinospica sp.]|nr:CopD family protein [Actinospica sp.]